MARKMTETLAHGYTTDSTQRELSNKYQHDSVKMVFKNIWTKVALAVEGSVFQTQTVKVLNYMRH